jgi:hypothetical protein
MRLTLEFLNVKKIDEVDKVIKWLDDKGGYCDYEVLYNVEEQFE